MNIHAWLILLSAVCMDNMPPRKSVILPGDVGMEFAYIAPGEFTMGSPVDERDRDGDEGPQRSVTLSRGFYIGVYEVTQRQWIAVMGKNPSVFKQEAHGENSLDRPVDSVSWKDTQEFCERMHILGLGRFRLPTEAEWEFAARAGTTSLFSFEGDVHKNAWANSRSHARSHPVGLKTPNANGLFDVHGNVWEWCQDWYAPYNEQAVIDPLGPLTGQEKVFRGGSWYDFPNALRSANRHRHALDKGYSSIGLRLVMESSFLQERVAILPGNVKMHFASIAAGEFSMGSPAAEIGRAMDEGPTRQVILSKAFAMGIYEVTQQQWCAVMGDNPAVFQDNHRNPVEMVSWNDTQEFLTRLNTLNLGGNFRLPTEAEWEYAARSGTTTRYSFGDDPDYRTLSQYAWFYPQAEGRSHPVGVKKPNNWGLFDMHGGVWEWCSDGFASFDESKVVNDPTGPAEGDYRIIRGGSWFNEPEALRSANRHRHHVDSRQTNIGFRVVWIVP